MPRSLKKPKTDIAKSPALPVIEPHPPSESSEQEKKEATDEEVGEISEISSVEALESLPHTSDTSSCASSASSSGEDDHVASVPMASASSSSHVGGQGGVKIDGFYLAGEGCPVNCTTVYRPHPHPLTGRHRGKWHGTIGKHGPGREFSKSCIKFCKDIGCPHTVATCGARVKLCETLTDRKAELEGALFY